MCLTRLTNDFLNMILIIFKSILIVSITPEVREAEYSVDFHHCMQLRRRLVASQNEREKYKIPRCKQVI